MRLRLVRHPARADGSYEGATGAWRPGDVREVEPLEAAELTASFPGAFVLEEDRGEPAATDDRERQPPKPRKKRGRARG